MINFEPEKAAWRSNSPMLIIGPKLIMVFADIWRVPERVGSRGAPERRMETGAMAAAGCSTRRWAGGAHVDSGLMFGHCTGTEHKVNTKVVRNVSWCGRGKWLVVQFEIFS